MADNLREILDIAKREMPDIPDEVWARFECLVRYNFGATRPYIAAQRKRAHLETLASMDEKATSEVIAEKMGISPSRVRQLRAIK